jgi:hypothetical protein
MNSSKKISAEIGERFRRRFSRFESSHKGSARKEREMPALASLYFTVRLYASDATTTVSPRAVSVATTLLRDAGVHVTWTFCRSGGHSEATCDSPMQSTDLAVRMVRCVNDSDSRVCALGYALIDRQQRTGALATVYVDRVSVVAQESRMDPSVLLGRTIAHEIGHLLMGTNRHSGKGLMRALWSRQDLRRRGPDEWRFTALDMAAIRDRRALTLVASR